MQVNPKDLAAGVTFMAIGLFFALNAWFELRIGQAFAMGPGYFPLLLGSILVCFGLAIAFTAINKRPEAFGRVSWRGIGLVTASIIFFAVTVRGLGMAAALYGGTFMAALSAQRTSLLLAIVLSACLTAFSILVFIYALKLPYPVIGPWLTG